MERGFSPSAMDRMPSRSISRYREMLLEGILSIAEGENPRSIELKLQGFMD